MRYAISGEQGEKKSQILESQRFGGEVLKSVLGPRLEGERPKSAGGKKIRVGETQTFKCRFEGPMLNMAAEYFTHLGVAYTEFSVSEIFSEETDELLQVVNEQGGSGKRKQKTFKSIGHIIPNSTHRKPDTLKCVAIFPGAVTRDVVMSYLDKNRQCMNMERNAHVDYDDFVWGIEAKEEGGEVAISLIPHRRYSSLD
ncbi:hypothetical protein BJV74DRAFT_796476 [Russula compacta]|nr:hypothetical protein BJV74DRAFT_796476 [Russula compacta]